MGKARSFEAINYSLRPNKNVERKLIAKSLAAISSGFDVSGYRYIGFGSIWFVDFILFHRQLGICDMYSIEKVKSRKKRVEFNKPLGCIQLKMEDASNALPSVIDEKRTLVWLDYDGALESALGGDIETAIQKMSSGSILLVTINAEVDQLKHRIVDGEEVSPERFLAHIADDTLLEDERDRLTPRDFPKLASELLINKMISACLDHRPKHDFVPIWNFEYQDGVVMITVGGMIVDDKDKNVLQGLNLQNNFDYMFNSEPYEVSLPILTDKEKREIDRLLPSSAKINAGNLPFELRDKEIEAYRKYYLHYPIFNELTH